MLCDFFAYALALLNYAFYNKEGNRQREVDSTCGVDTHAVRFPSVRRCQCAVGAYRRIVDISLICFHCFDHINALYHGIHHKVDRSGKSRGDERSPKVARRVYASSEHYCIDLGCSYDERMQPDAERKADKNTYYGEYSRFTVDV